MTTVAWIGLGRMGTRMARRVAAAGHSLTVWNRTPGRAGALAAVGARVAPTPAAAVRDAEVVFLMLADPTALAGVVEGPAGVAAGLGKATTVIDMSTVGPAAVGRLAHVLPCSTTLLDAPVLGSLAEAEEGTLTILIGGPEPAVESMRTVLSLLGDPIHLGPSGSGAAAKLVANFALLGTVGLLGESLAVADGLGLPREVTWRLLAYTSLAAQAARRRTALEADDFPPRFPLSLARKDADLVVAGGVDARLARATLSWLTDAESAGLGDLDYTALLGHILRSPAGNHPGPDRAIPAADAPHHRWDSGCDGWRLVDPAGLSVIEESLPPGTVENRPAADRSRRFIYVLDGGAAMRTADGEVALRAGSGVHVPPDTPHQIANPGRRDLRLLVISTTSTCPMYGSSLTAWPTS
ncbi:NAD(P)-binding domain-containing protein [Polymorphospora rubra]|uniref:3-hydroxyisobutyrate dehydrogenase n=1 Tax=Polymorphospora rubra TaxID=338584 RepID=A0A810N575_9ACTN|nr:NAD(P)-binding domain-containing protein [Polymorphospora rubra]BCJ68100.1 hypothetical protein Prubr_51210 [Polymorphospora rubra]